MHRPIADTMAMMMSREQLSFLDHNPISEAGKMKKMKAAPMILEESGCEAW